MKRNVFQEAIDKQFWREMRLISWETRGHLKTKRYVAQSIDLNATLKVLFCVR